VLQNNGGNNLSIGGNGPFVFTDPVNLGAAYNVTVLDQPTSPAQTCTVSNGSGTANAAVTSVQIVCSVTLGGTVSGLAGTGLVLQFNGANNLPISSDGAFTFTTPIASGSDYTVSVLTQPAGPAQVCLVLEGSGIATESVTNIQVICSAHWTLRGNNSSASYGSLGVAAATNLPPARTNPATWKDAAGGFWMYGGLGYSDLWKYGAGEWTWMGGSNLTNQPGVYGTLGVANAANTPGARNAAAYWTDASGNFWLFGGGGVDAQGDSGEFNDMWMYSKGQWTWMSGPNTPNVPGSFGKQGVAAASNLPEPRISAATWVDASGNLWLFGGEKGTGGPSDELLGWFGDLWMYSAGQWTWVGGSTGVDQGGSYGVLGTPASGNMPGARTNPVAWTTNSGEVFLFGGFGYDKNDTFGDLSDLWSYSGGQWTWLAGADTDEVPGLYGMLGVAAASNHPGARDTANAWVDASGDLWLFGGEGDGSTGSFTLSLGDTWKYSNGEWTWMDGSDAVSRPPIYETLGSAGYPGARTGAASWTDGNGNLWLFSGADYGHTSSGSTEESYNDLWEYQP
jgi:N-acetylneuraminic acid mutarotase